MICLMGLAITSCDKDNTDTETTETGTTPAGYVDLGLPSGTLWKASNESGYYDYYSAIETFGIKLPTTEQFGELISYCTYSWDSERKGANFVSTVNGKSIFLPAAGGLGCDDDMNRVGSYGYYRSFTPDGLGSGWYLFLSPGIVGMYNGYMCNGQSVRLVK